MGSNGYKASIPALLFDYFNKAFMVIVAFATIVPFLYVASLSLTNQEDLSKYGYALFPHRISFENYIFIFEYNFKEFMTALKNSLFITIIGSILNVVITAMIAYPLANKKLPGRTFLTMAIFFTMLFGGGLIPTYLVVNMTGLTNSLWAMIVPQLVSVWNMLIMRNFFMTIPESLEEAAKIDGCSLIKIIFVIIFPLSLPVIATTALFYAVDHWNDWFNALIYIRNTEKHPLMLFLRNIITAGSQAGIDSAMAQMAKIPTEGLKNATIMLTITPIVILYPFAQKYFVKGVLIGSVKG